MLLYHGRRGGTDRGQTGGTNHRPCGGTERGKKESPHPSAAAPSLNPAEENEEASSGGGGFVAARRTDEGVGDDEAAHQTATTCFRSATDFASVLAERTRLFAANPPAVILSSTSFASALSEPPSPGSMTA